MSKEEILILLNDKKSGSYYKNILELCKTPTSPGDLMKAFSSQSGRFTRLGQDAFAALLNLKNKGAIDFKEGKYFTTPLGLSTLASS